ncbi:hypothetical protein Bca4012_083097 [Brassica carinata]
MEENSTLRRDLTAANRVIAEHRDKFRSMENMFDLFLESHPNPNPTLASMWRTLRPSFDPDPIPEEQTDLEQRGSDYFDDIDLNL